MYLAKATEQLTRLGRSLFLESWFRSSSLRAYRLLITFFIIFPAISISLAAENLTLQADQSVSTAGYYQISWTLDEEKTDVIYIVTEIVGDNSITIYEGTDTATVLSGKPDGTYSYIVRSKESGHISNQVSVAVSHHSLSTAFIFFSLGAIVFIALLIAIFFGNKNSELND